MTTVEWKALKVTIETYLSSGQWLKREITIEGDKVVFTSLSQVQSMLAYVNSKIIETEEGVDASSGLRTSAVFTGNGLR